MRIQDQIGLEEREKRIADAEARLKQSDCGAQAQTAYAPLRTNLEIENDRIRWIQDRLSYHAPRPDQLPRYQALRDAALVFATAMVRNVPSSMELDQALTLIEDALMKANKGIALGY